MTKRNPVPPIATLTLNPCLDVSYEFPALIPDQKVRADHNRYDPGGNGLNVGRALKRLSVHANNCTLLGGEIGLLVKRLVVDQLDDITPVQIEGETRINCTILEKSPHAQYELDGAGPEVNARELAAISERFLQAAAGGFGVLTGSLPPGVPDSIYGDLTKRLSELGGLAVVDTHGPALQYALDQHPFLIKPNRYELSRHVGHELPTLEDVVEAARSIQQAGVSYVCVSLGGDGAIMVGPEGGWHATSPQVAVRSTVGAGDSLVGGLVAAFARGKTPAEALRLGVSCGSGTAAQPGTRLFDPVILPALMNQVVITELSI